MNRPGEAIVHYQRAAEQQTQTPIEALLSMGEMATCKILTRELSDVYTEMTLLLQLHRAGRIRLVPLVVTGDYDGALSVFTEMQLMCQERGLQLPGTTTPVGEALIHGNMLTIFTEFQLMNVRCLLLVSHKKQS